MTSQQRKLLFAGALLVAGVCILGVIYYAIPGFHHVLSFNSHPNTAQPKHIIGLVVITVLAFLGAYMFRPSAAASLEAKNLHQQSPVAQRH